MIAATIIPDNATVLEASQQAEAAGCVLATDGRRIVICPRPLPAGWHVVPINTARLRERRCRQRSELRLRIISMQPTAGGRPT